MPEFKFENLLKLSLPIILVLGVVQQSSYYYQFNLPVIQYLDLSEIPIIFLGDLSIYMNLLLPVSLLLSVKRGMSLLNLGFSFLLIIPLTLVLKLNGGFYFHFSTMFLMVLMAVVFIILIVFKTKVRILLSGSNTANKVLWVTFGIIIFLIILSTSVTGYYKAYIVKRNGAFKGSIVELENTRITSNNTQYYIGHSKNYVYIYDAIEKETTAIPMNRVRLIKTKYKIGSIGGNHPKERPRNP